MRITWSTEDVGDSLDVPEEHEAALLSIMEMVAGAPGTTRVLGQHDRHSLEAADALVKVSQWIDHHNINRGTDPEAITWGRLAKIMEEGGEVIEAFIGYTQQNPRKDVRPLSDVKKELLDTAVTALGAYEHLDEHQGLSIAALFDHIRALNLRRLEASRESQSDGRIDDNADAAWSGDEVPTGPAAPITRRLRPIQDRPQA